MNQRTGTRDLKLVMGSVGGIQGLASTSDAAPIKTADLNDRFQNSLALPDADACRHVFQIDLEDVLLGNVWQIY